MHRFKAEKKLFAQGYKIIGGIDEAGRGALAGPVVAACVCCSPKFKINSRNRILASVDDSKRLSRRTRESLYKAMANEKKFSIGIGIVSNYLIDKLNINQANLLAMRKAVRAARTKLDFLLIDGQQLVPRLTVKQRAIIKGDKKIFLIAAASIIAKVTRDRIMANYHHRYQQFNFFKNKGYGTSEHRELINIYGPCRLHRRSYAPIKTWHSFNS